MSQTPPPPYRYPPPLPPYGQPPGLPPPYAPSRTSAAAIASLVLGILGCVPFVTGLVAVVLGIVGIRSTGRPGVRGRGMAIAGLILGLLSLIVWAGFGGLGLMLYRATAPDRAVSRQFLVDLSTGNTTAAAAECLPGTSADLIQQASDQVKPLGALTGSTFFSMSMTKANGTSSAVVGGNARFGTTPKAVQITLTPGSTGKRLVQSWTIQ